MFARTLYPPQTVGAALRMARPSGAGPSATWTPAVARFYPGDETGSLEPDTCFGTDEFNVGFGVRSYSFGGSELITGVAVQEDGRIVLVGATTDRSSNDDLIVLRIRPDGEIDRGLGTDGIVYLDFGRDEQSGSVVIDRNGRLVVAWASIPSLIVAWSSVGLGSVIVSIGGQVGGSTPA